MAIIVNLYGGPGCGKSTTAAYVFSKLKMLGVNAELVTEFAKDKTWEGNTKALRCQPYVFGKQVYRIDRCIDDVDVIVTDSPLLLSVLYNTDEAIKPHFTNMVFSKYAEYDNLNYILHRKKAYNPKGRNQTEDEAKILDCCIFTLLDANHISYKSAPGDITGAEEIVKDVLAHLCVENA